jgi:excisionase family DNA binding protein
VTNGTPEQEDQYLSPLQVAQELGVSDQSVYDWIRNKRLPATRVGNRALRIRRSDLDRMLAARSTTTSSDPDEQGFYEDPSIQDFQPPGRESQRKSQ